MSTDKEAVAQTQSHVTNPKHLTLRSQVIVVSRLLMPATHPLMVMDSCAIYSMPISNKNNYYGQGTKTSQKPYKIDLRVESQGEWGL